MCPLWKTFQVLVNLLQAKFTIVKKLRETKNFLTLDGKQEVYEGGVETCRRGKFEKNTRIDKV